MPQYICLLRGINVSGKNIIPMTQLKLALEQSGLHQVRTYIQSGNIVFNSDHKNSAQIENGIELLIQSNFDLKIKSMVIPVADFTKMLELNPFKKEAAAEPSRMILTFLECIPNAEGLQKIPESGKDQWKIIDRCVYLYCPDGYGKTKLTHSVFESKLKIKATARNWRTCEQLALMTAE